MLEALAGKCELCQREHSPRLVPVLVTLTGSLGPIPSIGWVEHAAGAMFSSGQNVLGRRLYHIDNLGK